MLTSLALIFLVGLAMAALCQMIRLPRIIGMLLTGILLGPYVLNLLDDSILMISADLREMALVIILIKAGLSLKLQDLKAVGRPAPAAAHPPLGHCLFPGRRADGRRRVGHLSVSAGPLRGGGRRRPAGGIHRLRAVLLQPE